MHIDEKTLQRFREGSLDTEETIALLSHMEECNLCMDAVTEQTPCITAPSYLKEQILTRAKEPDIQAALTIRQTSRKMELFIRGLHTAFGVLAALFMLFALNSWLLPPLLSGESPAQKQAQEQPWEPESPEEERENLYDFTQGISFRLSQKTNDFAVQISDLTNQILYGGK